MILAMWCMAGTSQSASEPCKQRGTEDHRRELYCPWVGSVLLGDSRVLDEAALGGNGKASLEALLGPP